MRRRVSGCRRNYNNYDDMNSIDTTLLGVKIGTTSLDTLTDHAMQAIGGKREQIAFACANPHSLVEAVRDIEFRDALNQSEQVVADGIGVVLTGRLVGAPVEPRITGADYFHSVMSALEARGGGRVFFMGSTPGVLDRIQRRAAKEFPNLKIGVHSPPFGEWSPDQRQAVIDAINDFDPDVLWVGMTAPKQEKWVHANRSRLNAAVIGSIGAVFDFYAETHPRAPGWMHNNGLEWLYRLLREPRRMWRRNFVSAPKFLWLVLWERLRGFGGRAASSVS